MPQKFQHSGLNDWAETDKPVRSDFWSDNNTLDGQAMWKSAYDATGAVAQANGIPAFVKAAGVASAAKLTTARNISLSGAVTGTATAFNGTKAITIPTTLNLKSFLTVQTITATTNTRGNVNTKIDCGGKTFVVGVWMKNVSVLPTVYTCTNGSAKAYAVHFTDREHTILKGKTVTFKIVTLKF